MWGPNMHRKKRMGELAAINTASVYNQVYHLQKPDYSRDVTEASSKAHVLVLLTSSHGTNGESRVMIDIWRQLAQRFGDVKFCQMRADLCIEGYPEKNTPTVLIYKDGDIKKQIVTLRELKGGHTTAEGECISPFHLSPSLWISPYDWSVRSERPRTARVRVWLYRPNCVLILYVILADVEGVLVDVGAVQLNDTRLQRNKKEDADASSSKIRQGTTVGNNDEDDSDWD
jgi:hypothetical protein